MPNVDTHVDALSLGRGRVLVGHEALRFQNIRYANDRASEIIALSAYAQDQTQDLGGNAFQSNCCAAAVASSVVAVGRLLELLAAPAAPASGPLRTIPITPQLTAQALLEVDSETSSSCDES